MSDTFGNRIVPDPYRWLEDMQSPDTRAWLVAQDAFARAYASRWTGRDSARAAIARGHVPLVTTAPVKEGGRYFFTRTHGGGGGTTRSLTLVGRDRDSVTRTVIGGEALFKADSLQVRRTVVAPNGRLVAYGVARGGTQVETIRVRDVDLGRDLDDRLEGIEATSTLVWSRDGTRGFYYTRFSAPDRLDGAGPRDYPRVMYHRLDAPRARDEVVFARPDHPEWVLTHTVSDDGRFLVINARVGITRRDRVFVQDLRAPGSAVVPLTVEGDAEFAFVGSKGNQLWFVTDYQAPMRRIVAIDVGAPTRAQWKDLVPEGRDPIDTWGAGATAIGDYLLVKYRKDAVLTARVYDARGRFRYPLTFPRAYESMWSVGGRQSDGEGFYVLQGVADAGTVFSLDVATGRSTVFARAALPYDPADFVTKQVFFRGKDGTRVPMYVVHHKSTRLDGTAPGMVYGYGFDAWSGSPWFQPMVAEFMREGGVWALANIRGGGEYGSPWAEAGRRRRKQTSIDDFLAAAAWLQDNRYVARGKLIANSGSAGGVIAAAAVQQRPGLFAGAILDYPVIDMLRYHLFSGGARWTEEYGTVADSADFATLISYSPMHNVKPGPCYPPVMLSPGELDKTAVPMHAYKLAATLQYANAATPGCASTAYLRVSWGAGHNAGATSADQVENWADQLAFMHRVIGWPTRASGSSASARGPRSAP
ncbi:MAG: S9 family peptidase [Gemmatimonadetes bacterium]|nr:S9 family peptidase [Gemmatimonadota bacterium]